MLAPVELSVVLNPQLGSLTEATICRYFRLALSDLSVEQKLSQCGAFPFSPNHSLAPSPLLTKIPDKEPAVHCSSLHLLAFTQQHLA